MKLAELVVKIANLEKAIVAKSEKAIVAKLVKLSILTSQKNSIMLPLPTNGGSSSAETFGGFLD